MATESNEYTVDKTGWPDGPWHDEPDKIVWVDEATDLDCMIVRGNVGALCGYGVVAELVRRTISGHTVGRLTAKAKK